MAMTEQQREQIIELLQQLNTRLTDITASLDVINTEIANIYL